MGRVGEKSAEEELAEELLRATQNKDTAPAAGGAR